MRSNFAVHLIPGSAHVAEQKPPERREILVESLLTAGPNPWPPHSFATEITLSQATKSPLGGARKRKAPDQARAFHDNFCHIGSHGDTSQLVSGQTPSSANLRYFRFNFCIVIRHHPASSISL